MPTLEEVATLNAADREGRRFELSPAGELSVLTLPDSEHAALASRLMIWLVLAGHPVDQVLQSVGILIPGPGTGFGGRRPDLTVWARPQVRSVWLPVTDLLLAVEIVSAGSEGLDQVTKRQEYAQAGIPRYWVVDRDAEQTVTLHTLGADEPRTMPLARLVQTRPADHTIGG